MQLRDLPKLLLFTVAIRPVNWLLIRLKVYDSRHLPRQGPAVIIANHNSHWDTLLLMSLFPLQLLPKVRPVAAADYFFANSLSALLAQTFIGAVPVMRKLTVNRDPLQDARAALENGDILILFPEGTRGQPGKLSPLRKGIAYLACTEQRVPVTPIYLRGLERQRQQGKPIIRLIHCDAHVYAPIQCNGEHAKFMEEIEQILRGPNRVKKDQT